MIQTATTSNFSAPGKLVLIGEYAVTQGLPALSLAIDRRARVSRKPTTDKAHCLLTSLEPEIRYEFEQYNGSIRWHKTPPDAIARFTELLPWPDTGTHAPGTQLNLNTDQFYLPDSDQKLGLGSSASLMLTATTALGGNFALARQLHHEFQGQAGSGVDIATSYHGGLICFQQHQVNPLQLPTNFFWQAVWTGQSAKTSHFLQAFASWIKGHPTHWQTQCESAAILIAAAITACTNDDGLGLLANMRAYAEWMRELGGLINAHIYTPEHEFLRELALASGAVWKPSGAGGGDIGIVCAHSRQKLEQICQTITDSGYTILNLHPDIDGLK